MTVNRTLNYEMTDGSYMAVGVEQRHQNQSLRKNSVVLCTKTGMVCEQYWFKHLEVKSTASAAASASAAAAAAAAAADEPRLAATKSLSK